MQQNKNHKKRLHLSYCETTQKKETQTSSIDPEHTDSLLRPDTSMGRVASARTKSVFGETDKNYGHILSVEEISKRARSQKKVVF